MKIYLSHSSKIDYINELYEPIQKGKLEKDHEFVYFCEDPKYPSKNSKGTIRSCDLLIAEMSECSTGMGIEIGWADMMEIPIIVVHKSTTEISNYMKSIAQKIIEYTDSEDLVKKLSKHL